MIEQSLPNGFHDSQLVSIHIDRPRRLLEVVLGVDISIAEHGEKEGRFRLGRLLITGLEFVAVDPPFVGAEPGDLSVDVGELSGDRLREVYPAPLPADCFAIWLFMNDTKGFVRFAGRGATFEWLEEKA